MNWLTSAIGWFWSTFYVSTGNFWSSPFTIVGVVFILAALFVIAWYGDDYKTAIENLKNAIEKRGKPAPKKVTAIVKYEKKQINAVKKAEEDKKYYHKSMVGVGLQWFLGLSFLGAGVICIQGNTLPWFFLVLAVALLCCIVYFLYGVARGFRWMITRAFFALTNLKYK